MALRVVLAASANVEDLEKAGTFLQSKGIATDIVTKQSEVIAFIQQSTGRQQAAVIIAQASSGSSAPDEVDALQLLQLNERPQIAVMMGGGPADEAQLLSAVQLGALDILQAPISEQTDRLHFLAAKWQHVLKQQQQQNSSEFGDFSAALVESAPDGFSLDIPHVSSHLEDPLDDLLGPSSATSCGTALNLADWEQSERLAESILPGVFGDDGMSSHPTLDLPFDALVSYETSLLLDQPSGSSDSSTSHVAAISRQTSLSTCELPGKRKSEEYSELSRGASSDTSQHSDLMDDARYKKQKVEWTSELHSIFVSAVEKIGADKAVPSQILNDMGIFGTGLTRQNIASHLQKYRARSRAAGGSLQGKALAPLPPLAPPECCGAVEEAVVGVPASVPSVPCQVPALVPGVVCWTVGGCGMASPSFTPASGYSNWLQMAVPLPQPAPAAMHAHPSPQLLASLHGAMREPNAKLPIGLQLDTNAVLNEWKSGKRA